jgi:hypothetical protein
VQAVIAVLADYIAKVSDCVNKTETQLRFIQRKLNMENAKWAAMRHGAFADRGYTGSEKTDE